MAASSSSSSSTQKPKISSAEDPKITPVSSDHEEPKISSTEDPTITLVSSDNEEFVVLKSLAEESKVVKNLLIELESTRIPLKNVTGKILGMVIKYCKVHAEFRANTAVDKTQAEKVLKDFDAKFVNVDHETLLDLIHVSFLIVNLALFSG